ncbi:MAG: hypothetical protein HY329_04160, partial [Chloroflexi bacterium]|nr:hypothetical protein [Chloroflexota bacterium]
VQVAPGTAAASREPTTEWVCRERPRRLTLDRIAPNSELGIVLGVTSQWPLLCERKVISPALPPAAARLGPITDEDVAKTDQLVAFLNTSAGQPGFEPAWYQTLVGVAVRGDTALALTTLAAAEESRELAASACRGLSGFAYADANKGLGLTKVQVNALEGRVLVSRGSATETCAGTSIAGAPAGTSPTTAPATPQAVK